LVILLGMMEYGFYMWKLEQVYNVARQAARVGALATASNTQVTSQIDSMMNAYGLVNSQANTVYTTSINPSNVATLAKGSTLTVTITVNYSKIQINGQNASQSFEPTWGWVALPMPSTATGTVTMVKEGQ